MTRQLITIILFLLGICLFSNSSSAEDATLLKTRNERLGYSMGVAFVRDLLKMNPEIDSVALRQGIRDASSGGSLLLEEPEMHRLVNQYKMEQMQKRGKPNLPEHLD